MVSTVNSECWLSMKMKSWPVVLAMRAISPERASRTFMPSATLSALNNSFSGFGAETAGMISLSLGWSGSWRIAPACYADAAADSWQALLQRGGQDGEEIKAYRIRCRREC